MSARANPARGRWAGTLALRVAGAGVLLMAARPAPAIDLSDAATNRIRHSVEAREFQGSVLLARGDSVLFERTFTLAGPPPRTAPCYGIGSITKTFTAAAIQRLERQGKLRLDDPLSRFAPGFPHGDSITVEQLLLHTAGIPDYYTDPTFPKRRTEPMTPRALADWLATKPLDFPPGSQSRYSNSGYALLALVIEQAGGVPYDAYVRHAFLDSLGLHDTGTLSRPHAAPCQAPGFDPGPLPMGTMQPVTFDWSWLVGSGSLYSTPRDLLRWTRAVLRDSLVSRGGHPDPYGWGIRERHHRRVIEQTGRIPAGYAAKVSYLPDADLTVVVLANLQSESVNRLADDLETLALGDTLARPATRRVVSLAAWQVDSLAGRYEVFPGLVLTVRRQSRSAWLAGPDGDFMPLDALDASHFYFRLLDVTVDFERKNGGRSAALLWNGQFRAPRVP